MSRYQNLTPEEQGNVMSAMAGLKLNAKQGKPITRKDVNAAFMKATGKSLDISYMRDPAVVQMMSLITPTRGNSGIRDTATIEEQRKMQAQRQAQKAGTDITDKNLATRGLPVPKPSSGGLSSKASMATTRYSAKRS